MAGLPPDLLGPGGVAVAVVVVGAAAAAAAPLLWHRSLISSRPCSRALVKTAEHVSVLSRKLDTQKTMWLACGL